MKHIIQLHVYKGEEYYVAEGVDLPVVTQAKTLDELAINIQEAVDVQLSGEDPADFGLAKHSALQVNLELVSPAYA